MLLLVAPATQGANDLSSHWNGTWIAEGTLFKVAVLAEDGMLKVTQLESLGFKWSNEDGVIDGNIARLSVDYAGVKGVIQAELVAPDRAIVIAARCTPEFMVVCVLAKNRQAVFRKIQTTSALD